MKSLKFRGRSLIIHQSSLDSCEHWLQIYIFPVASRFYSVLATTLPFAHDETLLCETVSSQLSYTAVYILFF